MCAQLVCQRKVPVTGLFDGADAKVAKGVLPAKGAPLADKVRKSLFESVAFTAFINKVPAKTQVSVTFCTAGGILLAHVSTSTCKSLNT